MPASARPKTGRTPIPLLTSALLAALAAGCTTHTHPADTRPTRQITYRVTGHGTAAITWPGGTDPHAKLPWHLTTRIHVTTAPPRLTLVLGPRTTTAACTITAGSRTVAGSHATGPHGRATCQAPALTAGPTDG